MKILGILALIEIILFVFVITFKGIDIDLILYAFSQTMAHILGGLAIIYPVINLVMNSKTKLKYWHFFGILMVTLYTVLTMYILAFVLGNGNFMEIDYIGYYMQSAFTVVVILLLRKKHGFIEAEIK